MENNEMLGRLVDNAFDFLNKAVVELNDYPKFSVINFHAAVELFLKARLMKENWSLVVSNRQEPNWDKFISGNFQSVSLDEAADRLEKIVRSGLTKPEFKSFKEITRHRNKVVHFYHEAHSAAENREKIRSIVKQQLTAWYYLHNILTNRWNDVFCKWSDPLLEVDKKLRSLHTFLQIVYDQIKPDIEGRKQNGELYSVCPSCGFEAQNHQVEPNEIYEANCLVCNLTDNVLKISCPSCYSEVIFINEGFGKCSCCGESFEPENLAEILMDEGSAYVAIKEGDSSWDLGNCSNCDGYHTVVRTESDEYICTSCFLTQEQVEYCQWCNEPNTGDMGNSYWAGCSHCDGKAGWDSDE